MATKFQPCLVPRCRTLLFQGRRSPTNLIPYNLGSFSGQNGNIPDFRPFWELCGKGVRSECHVQCGLFLGEDSSLDDFELAKHFVARGISVKMSERGC